MDKIGIKDFGVSFISLLTNIEAIENDMLRETYFDICKNIIGPLGNLIETEKFHKRMTQKEYDTLKKNLGNELNKFEALKKKVKDEWNWQ
jgi:hypothetical protein